MVAEGSGLLRAIRATEQTESMRVLCAMDIGPLSQSAGVRLLTGRFALTATCYFCTTLPGLTARAAAIESPNSMVDPICKCPVGVIQTKDT